MEKLRIEDLRKELNLGELGDRFTEYGTGYICDIFTEIADSNVDIYYSDLFEWAKGNTSYIEDALDEFGTPETNGHADFIRIIQQGQYYYYEQDLYENMFDIIENYVLNYIENVLELEEITQEQYDNLKFEIDFNDNNNELEYIDEKIREVLGVEA